MCEKQIISHYEIMASSHFSYFQLLNGIRKIEDCFEVKFLTVPGEKFKLVKFAKIISSNYPLLMIMAGCHGEEPAPSLAIFKNYKIFSEAAKKIGVNLVFYPLVNPWGFDRDKRLNRILKDGKYGDIEVENGAVYNHHDGSAEDFMFHRGCRFSCCTETPSPQPLSKRIKCNSDLILKFIELSKRR